MSGPLRSAAGFAPTCSTLCGSLMAWGVSRCPRCERQWPRACSNEPPRLPEFDVPDPGPRQAKVKAARSSTRPISKSHPASSSAGYATPIQNNRPGQLSDSPSDLRVLLKETLDVHSCRKVVQPYRWRRPQINSGSSPERSYLRNETAPKKAHSVGGWQMSFTD